jgi:hypothetical protein|tara:strand:+ start:1117 stop:2097 length:981 start_codon:yes stop_codon:yes gene_type:complete
MAYSEAEQKDHQSVTDSAKKGKVNIISARGTAFNKTSIRYPEKYDIGVDSDYVAFKFYDYQPPFQVKNKKGGEGVGRAYNDYNAGIQKENLKEAEGYQPIFMYMPQDIQGQYGANWGGASFGVTFTNLARMIGSGGIPDLGSFNRTVQGVLTGPKVAGFKMAVDNLNKGLGSSVSLSQLMSGVSGTIVNPNVEMMYESPEMRGFQLRFKMQARSALEATAIKTLCYQFKKALHASYGGQTFGGLAETSGFITVPKLCQVSFMTGTSLNQYVPQYKPCAITQVDINYTPDGAWASLTDGAPVATELAVTFKETKLIYSQEITMGASY